MSVPRVVIVGRPNVGKSSLLNWLAGRRLAIVDDMAGVTRDRMGHLIEEEGRYLELIDTGGIGVRDSDDLTEEVERQIEVAIDQADVILFVVDARTGPTPLDQQVDQRLRAVDKPVVLVVNKCDAASIDLLAEEFHQMGRQPLVRVSAEQKRNREELMRAVFEHLPEPSEIEEAPGEPVMKLAIVGRRNTGKSTFVNTLAQSERMIVSEVAGTTRDSVDVMFEMDGKPFIAIDTPGLRRGKSVRTDIDFYSDHRAKRSIRRADVVLLFFDAGQRMSKVDKQLANYIEEQYKPCVFVVNKWDKLAGELPTERWVEYLRENFATMWHTPIAFITGQTGKNVKTLINHAQMLFKQSRERIGTGELNRLVQAAVQHHPPPIYRQRRPKIFYATQVSAQPPTIVLMCSHPEGFVPSYRRYLLGLLRDQLSFGEVPIKLYFQKRSREEAMEGTSGGKRTRKR